MASYFLEVQMGEAIELIELIEVRGDDPTPFIQDVLLLMIRSSQLNFEAEGRPDRWADLAESTERRRFRKAAGAIARLGSLAALGSMMILRNTGQLWQSLGGQATGPYTTEYGFGESDEFLAVIGTNHPGAYNQFPDPRTNRPARVMVLWQEQDVEDVQQMAIDWMIGGGPYAAS